MPSRSRRSRNRFRIGALHRDVERRGDLVGDQHLRAHRERTRECHPLPLPAGEPAGQLAHDGRVEVDELEQLLDLAGAHRTRRAPPGAGGLGDRRAHGHAGIERGERVLEDHLHPPLQPADVAGAPVPRRDPVEQHLPAGDRDEPDDRLGEGGLARAGLPDQTDDRLLRHGEVGAVDRDQCRVPAPETDGQTTGLERGHASASSRMDSSRQADPSCGTTEFGCQQATR